MRWFIIFWIVVGIGLVLRFCFFFSTQTPLENKQHFLGEGIIQNQPKIVGSDQQFTILSQEHQIVVTTDITPAYWYGEKIMVDGNIKLSSVAGGYPRLSFPKITLSSHQSWIAQMTENIRSHVQLVYDAVLPADLSALLIGMVFGVQQQMSKGFLTALQTAGVMHVIAASGMNITLIAGAMMTILRRFFHRKVCIILSLCGVFFYTALAGFQPSIIRAAIMGGLAFSASLTGRQRQSVYILFLTASAMLFFNPLWIFDIGFQLSFFATAGILFAKSLIDVALRGFPWRDFVLFDDLSTTLTAQLATLPILLTNFGYINPLSVLINLLVLWTVPPLMLLGGIAGALSYIFQPLAELFVWIAYPLLWYFAGVVEWFAQLPTVWTIAAFPVTAMVGYYCVMAGVVMIGSRRKETGSKI